MDVQSLKIDMKCMQTETAPKHVRLDCGRSRRRTLLITGWGKVKNYMV